MTSPKSWDDYRPSRACTALARTKSARACTRPNHEASEAPVVTPPPIAVKIFVVLVPAFFILFAWAHAVAFIHTLRISILLILAKTVLELQFYVRKTTAPFVSTSAYAWLIALCGTLAPLMFRPTDDISDFSLATVMQVIGLAMLVYIITMLNRDSDMADPRRALRRDGLYRFVRHPIYLAFMFSQYGYVLNHATVYNACILALVTLFQVLRLNEEERLLLDDEEFQEYLHQTRWRMIPGVF